jgi:transmembrane sensor
MDDLSREMQSALGHVKAEWDVDVGAGEFGRRRRRRARLRVAAGVTAMVLVAAGGLLWLRRAPVAPPAIATRDPVLHFEDGSTATPTSADSLLSKLDGASFELVRGGARMVAKPAPELVIRMHRGPMLILSSRGAVFATDRIDDRLRVAVEDGEVRVGWGADSRVLGAGESGMFPPDPPPPVAPLAGDDERPAPRHPKPKPPEPSWRNLAREGDYDQAYEAMHRSAPPRDEPEELLLAADVARLSHHPAEALDPLGKIVRDHHDDARAPLAAFTLGRVLLDDLGRPREAADAFARAESLAPAGALFEDAVAREVEAWSRAGDTNRARARAEDYLKRFPDGRRQRAVRRFGGID